MTKRSHKTSKRRAPAKTALPVTPWPDRAPKLTRWAVIAAFGLAVAYVIQWKHPVGDYGVESDFYGLYAAAARAFLAGGLDPARYTVVGPVYEILLAALAVTRADLFVAAKWLSLVSVLVTLILWSGWLERRAGRGAGWVAALIMATNPALVRYAYAASTDAPFLALVSGAFVAIDRQRVGISRSLLAGALTGVATLTRYTGVCLVPLGLLVTAWRERKIRSGPILAYAAAVTLIVGSFWAFGHVKGSPVKLRFYHNLAYEVYARPYGISWDRYGAEMESQFPTLFSVLTRDPRAVADRLVKNATDHLVDNIRYLWLWPVSVLAGIGVLFVVFRRMVELMPPLAFGALLYLSLVPVFYTSRYALPLVPVAASMAAVALACRWGLPSLGVRIVPATLIHVITAIVLGGTVVMQTGVASQEVTAVEKTLPTEVLPLGRAIELDWASRGRPKLIARKPHLSYYANADPVAFPLVDSLEALAKYAIQTHADYLLISRPEVTLRQNFGFLLVPEFAPQGLKPIARGPGGLSIVYRIQPDFGLSLPAWYPAELSWRSAEGMIRMEAGLGQYWFLAGRGRQTRGDLAGAQAAYETALALHPEWSRLYTYLGEVLEAQGKYPEAVAALERATALGGKEPAIYLALGRALAGLGNYDRAEQALAIYLKTQSDPPASRLYAEVLKHRSAAH